MDLESSIKNWTKAITRRVLGLTLKRRRMMISLNLLNEEEGLQIIKKNLIRKLCNVRIARNGSHGQGLVIKQRKMRC